jgi:hypothetical protein
MCFRRCGRICSRKFRGKGCQIYCCDIIEALGGIAKVVVRVAVGVGVGVAIVVEDSEIEFVLASGVILAIAGAPE